MFFFPPVHGGAESYYNNLFPKLNGKKNIILFNNFFNYIHRKYGKTYIKDFTFEYLASLYILYMKKIQPKGPYKLFGWSFGGILAFEIARQLIDLGNEISDLIIIDSYFNYKNTIDTIAMSLNSEFLYDYKREDINYTYHPLKVSFPLSSKVLLFKASKENNFNNKIDMIIKAIETHYLQTSSNYIEKHISSGNLKVQLMNSSHTEWIYDDGDIDMIITEILR
jgi:pimeloyl-ACP methyl ester carboxylesterase